MDKRNLSKIERPVATEHVINMANRMADRASHVVTAELIENKKILLLNFFKIKDLAKGKTEAELRTFLSHEDYITQDLNTSKTKWITGTFERMQNFTLFDYVWDDRRHKGEYRLKVVMRSDNDSEIVEDFFKEYIDREDKYVPWEGIHRFQQGVLDRKLAARHKKETDKIDALMDPIKDPPKEFEDWVWDTGMSFSRYLIYKEEKKGEAVCECTHCKKIGTVKREDIRLRNNEKGTCPFCGSRVTIKARGMMPARIFDERWFLYVDPTEKGFVLRYFRANRIIRSDKYINLLIDKSRIEQDMFEYSRAIYTFPKGKPKYESYEWGVYKQRGECRWCPDTGSINCMECILYPGNLPAAWEHTPMKYSALEVLSGNMPTVSTRYEDAINKYMDFPKLEWICKMGLNRLAKDIINYGYSGRMVGKIKEDGTTIYEILGLNKVNTRLLQAVDGDHYELRLLQVAQQIGLQFKPEQLKEYYETFKCNTNLLKQANRKTTLHKIVKYISRESEKYSLGEEGGCWRYSYMRLKEREDPRIERKQNMAKDWLEYLGWCKEMKYDLDNMFIYMPTNFKKVHDRTAKEYQEFKDTQMRKRQAEMERKIKKILAETINLPAVMMKARGLVIIVPKSGDEIKEEGRTLHHCVGTYVERVAKGETTILFVRKESEPDIPYFTLEYRNGRVVQCRGKNNCGMTKDVRDFVAIFERKMQAEDKKRKAG